MLACVHMCSWAWGGGNAKGKIDEIVEEGKAEVTSNKACIHESMCHTGNNVTPDTSQGNTVTRKAREGDPAVKISGNKVLFL